MLVQGLINSDRGPKRDDCLGVALTLWRIESEISVVSADDINMSVLKIFDVRWSYKAIHHERNEPSHLGGNRPLL